MLFFIPEHCLQWQYYSIAKSCCHSACLFVYWYVVDICAQKVLLFVFALAKQAVLLLVEYSIDLLDKCVKKKVHTISLNAQNSLVIKLNVVGEKKSDAVHLNILFSY